MGKQTRFFFTLEEEDVIIRNLINCGYVVMDKNGMTLNIDRAHKSQLFISHEGVQLFKSGEFIDSITSEVIVFTRTKVFENKEITPGRIWYEDKFFNNEGKSCNKSKGLEIIYKKLIEQIKHNSSKSKCRDYYISDGIKQKVLLGGGVLKASPVANVEF